MRSLVGVQKFFSHFYDAHAYVLILASVAV